MTGERFFMLNSARVVNLFLVNELIKSNKETSESETATEVVIIHDKLELIERRVWNPQEIFHWLSKKVENLWRV